jgi:hypothetical protein
MLDPVACAGMVIGAPCVALSALVDLRHLLIAQGFRRSSADDAILAKEDRDQTVETVAASTPRQLSLALDFLKLRGETPIERSVAVALPACLLLEAAGRRAGGSATMTGSDLLPAAVLRRKAVVYVRHSTQAQVQTNL